MNGGVPQNKVVRHCYKHNRDYDPYIGCPECHSIQDTEQPHPTPQINNTPNDINAKPNNDSLNTPYDNFKIDKQIKRIIAIIIICVLIGIGLLIYMTTK